MRTQIFFLACFSWFVITTTPQQVYAESAEQLYREALDKEQYELATKIAIANFQAQWHCEVYLVHADKLIRAARQIVEGQATAQETDPKALQRAGSLLAEVLAVKQQAINLADQYVSVGQPPETKTSIMSALDEITGGFEDVSAMLDSVRTRAKPFAALIPAPSIIEEDVRRLELADKVAMGLHLADRASFARALELAIEDAQLRATGALKKISDATQQILSQWHNSASGAKEWDNLVRSYHDDYSALREELPENHSLAAWFIALVSHLARDHYDVSEQTIQLLYSTVTDARSQIVANGIDRRLLAAKLDHELFLLARRLNRWDERAPGADSLTLFVETHSYWYAFEAAMIAASLSSDAEKVEQLLGVAREILSTIESTNTPLATTLRRRYERYIATTRPFDEWLAVAMSAEYQDAKCTVLPEVLVETRPQLSRRVRAGFEQKIASSLAEKQIDRAFQLAQRAKALVVGRTLVPCRASQGQSSSFVASYEQVIQSKLLSRGVGGEMQIPRKELFLEYFIGPTQAWVFVIFAPGDSFEPLDVVELDRESFMRTAEEQVQALLAGKAVTDAGDWILGSGNSIEAYWAKLDEKLKKPISGLRRVVIAPDGLLSWLPLDRPEMKVGASVLFLPTAAVLNSAKALESRDVQLMWASQLYGLADHKPRIISRRGQTQMFLFKGCSLPIVMQDMAK